MYARYIPPSSGSKAATAPKSPAFKTSAATATAAETSASLPTTVDAFGYARYVPGSKPSKPATGTSALRFFDDESSELNSKRKREAIVETPAQDAKKLRRGKDLSGKSQEQGEKKTKNRRKRKQRTRAAEESSDDSSDDDSEPSPTVDTPKPAKSRHSKIDREEAKTQSKAEYQPIPSHQADSLEDVDVAMAEAPVNGLQDVNAEEQETKAKEKKRRKEKKKKSIDEDVEMDQDDEDDEKAQARHKAVLDRKAKSLKIAKEAAKAVQEELEEEPVELHGLDPLPQPAAAPEDDSKPTYDTLPSWLSAPIRVSQDTRTSFEDVGILPKAARVLSEKGYSEAFAVQTAAIPLLLPTSKQRPGDVLVSAATGSGKTLAYALPIVRDISSGVVTRLRALVVLPTRELVKQAQEVFEICAKSYEGEDRKRVRIGVAIGSQSIKSEQEAFIERESRYDPEAYKQIQEEIRRVRAEKPASADFDDDLNAEDGDAEDPRLGPWQGEVVNFASKVDVLICTPGRLVEHIEQTPGFNLDFVRWLVVDEADKLLAQSFQGWLERVLEKFQVNKFSARDFPDMNYSGVRKVILSATLTRDLSLLNQLALRRPRLIVLENDGAVQVAEHTLPATLRESAIRVHDNNLKPLYLLDLLQGQHMKAGLANGTTSISAALEASKDAVSDTSDDDSDTSSDSSDASDSSSESDSDTSDSGTSSEDEDEASTKATTSNLPISLIFTKSNESALRLSRLLTLLDKSMANHISTLTSTTPTHIRRKTLRAFTTPSSPIKLIIASDLVARGIDIPKLEHVINYDLPASVAGYVHRVGRTARAGRTGCAWTLVADDESGWFWGKIAKNPGVRRVQKVDRTRIEEIAEERLAGYEAALAKLGKEALELRRRK